MKKEKLPLLLYKELTISLRDGKNIITFEYFNVKKYKYEVFEIDQFFSPGDTVEIEIQRKKVYKALKRGFAPDLDLIEGVFKTHIIELENINKIADISWFDLFFCELRSWAPSNSRRSVGLFAGLILSSGIILLFSILSLLTKNVEIVENAITGFIFIYLGTAIFCEVIIKKRIEKNYYKYYHSLPSEFKDYMSRIIIPVAILVVIGSFYFYTKVLKMQL